MLAGASLFFLMLATGAIGLSGGAPATGAEAGGAPFVTAYPQQLSDGGYVLGGSILGCGGSYIQHALIE